MIRNYYLLFLLLLPTATWAQQDGLLQVRDDLHLFLLNAQTEGHLPEAFLTHLPLSAYEARRYLHMLDSTRTDEAQAYGIYLNGQQPPSTWITRWLPFLYANGQDVFSVKGDGYALQVNPLLYLSLGRAWEEGPEEKNRRITWQNTRGVRVSGHLGEHVFFESRIEENQTVLPPLIQQLFKKRLFALERPDYLPEGGLDYWRVTGMLGIRLPFVELRIGRDRNQWGYGLGSLLLSDYAPSYDQVQIRTTFWRIQYVNLYGLMTDPHSPATPGGAYAPRFVSTHHLSLRLHRRLQLGFFESAVLDPGTFSSRAQMLLAFLNPVIFYRAVDLSSRSPGNMLIGFDGYWQWARGMAFYGQFLLDEFKWSELTGGKGWWANKWGLLAGLHITRFPIRGTALWLEYTLQRPYLYSSRTTTLSYTHFNGTLGYPTGPNSRTLALYLTHRRKSYHTNLLLLLLQRGRNTENQNYGSDPIEPYTTRVADYGISLLQGVRQQDMLIEAQVGITLLPRLNLDVVLRYQRRNDAEKGLQTILNPMILLRWGLPYQSLYF